MDKSTWQERLRVESDELDKKCKKLTRALHEDSIPNSERWILSEQLDYMINYLRILDKRLDRMV